jgi:uncharacterized RDD family membrane protein YckC
MSNRTQPKSQTTQLLLGLVLGPLGLFYSSVPAAVLLSLLAAVLAKDTGGPGVLFVWPAALATGYFTVRSWNRRAEQRSAAPTTRQLGDRSC